MKPPERSEPRAWFQRIGVAAGLAAVVIWGMLNTPGLLADRLLSGIWMAVRILILGVVVAAAIKLKSRFQRIVVPAGLCVAVIWGMVNKPGSLWQKLSDGSTFAYWVLLVGFLLGAVLYLLGAVALFLFKPSRPAWLQGIVWTAITGASIVLFVAVIVEIVHRVL